MFPAYGSVFRVRDIHLDHSQRPALLVERVHLEAWVRCERLVEPVREADVEVRPLVVLAVIGRHGPSAVPARAERVDVRVCPTTPDEQAVSLNESRDGSPVSSLLSSLRR